MQSRRLCASSDGDITKKGIDMLVPAILYKEEIIKNMQKYFYTDDMMYETGCMDNWIPNITECPEGS